MFGVVLRPSVVGRSQRGVQKISKVLAATACLMIIWGVQASGAEAADPTVECAPVEATLNTDESLQIDIRGTCTNSDLISTCYFNAGNDYTRGWGNFNPAIVRPGELAIFHPYQPGEMTGSYQCVWGGEVAWGTYTFHITAAPLPPPPGPTPTPDGLISQLGIYPSAWRFPVSKNIKRLTVTFIVADSVKSLTDKRVNVRFEVPTGRYLGKSSRVCVLPTHKRASKRKCANPGAAFNHSAILTPGLNKVTLLASEFRFLKRMSRYEKSFRVTASTFDYKLFELGSMRVVHPSK